MQHCGESNPSVWFWAWPSLHKQHCIQSNPSVWFWAWPSLQASLHSCHCPFHTNVCLQRQSCDIKHGSASSPPKMHATEAGTQMTRGTLMVLIVLAKPTLWQCISGAAFRVWIPQCGSGPGPAYTCSTVVRAIHQCGFGPGPAYTSSTAFRAIHQCGSGPGPAYKHHCIPVTALFTPMFACRDRAVTSNMAVPAAHLRCLPRKQQPR
jgi:hypothetical protein